MRHAESYATKRAKGHELTKKQMALLKDYDDGTLLEKANELTLRSGHGTLRRPGDGVKREIGASTGGFVREILENWEPPDPKDFLEGDRVADLDEKQGEWESC